MLWRSADAACLIANIEVSAPVAYEEYRRLAPAAIAAHDGRYFARGGATIVLEGEFTPHRLMILEFSDMAKLKAFHESPEYQPLVAMRNSAARSSFVAVEGI